MKNLVVLLVLALAAVGCGSSDSDKGGSSGSSETTLTVLAASSLTETFDQLKEKFESDHPGVKVKIVYDSSATLAEMAARFPLREITFDGVAVPCTPAQVLERREDTTLYLSDTDPV